MKFGVQDLSSEMEMTVAPLASLRRGLVLGLMLVAFALSLVAAQSASAITFGMMSGDTLSWQEESGWNGMQHSGAKIFRAQIRGVDYNNLAIRAKIEKMFRMAAERDITILPYLYGRPSEEGSQQFPSETEWKSHEGEWTSFVNGVVQRFGYNGSFWTEAGHPANYKPVTAWEVWNEPNLKANNPGGSAIYPESYAKFLNFMSAKIKAAQAAIAPGYGIEVLFGGLYSEAGMSVGEFLKKASSVSGTGSSFNGLSLHPYSFQGGLYGVQQYVNDARTQLTNNFSSSKSLWITELGWNISPWGGEKNKETGKEEHLPVAESQQSEYLTASFNWLKEVSAAKNIPVVVWYIYRDGCGEDWIHHTGLVRRDGTFRPAWDAFQAETGAASWHGEPQTSWNSQDLCGVGTSDPDIVTTGANHFTVFERGNDNALWQNSTTGGEWSGWSSLGGVINTGPGATYTSDGVTHVFAGASDNSLWSWWGTGGWWGNEGLGGVITADPDASSWGSERLDVFARGSDNALWHRYWTASGGWKEWESLGGYLTSGPAAVSWSSNRIDVVARAADEKSLSTWYYDGTWHTGPTLGGGAVTTANPDITSTAPGHLTVAARGSDNGLWLLKYNSLTGGWGSSWEEVPDTSGVLASGPSAASGGGGRVDLVARRSENNATTHWWRTSPDWYYDNLGGNITSDPDISSWGNGRLDIFAKGAANDLQHKAFDGGSYSNWESLGGTLTSGPGAVSWGNNRIDVVARTTGNSVWHPSWASGWYFDNLGGNIASDPDISSWGYGRLDVFAKGSKNELLHKWFEGNWSSSWENLGGTLASGPSAVSWGPNRIDVVARATDNTVTHWAWNGSGWFVDNLGGNITSDPDISSWGSGRFDVFARGTGGELMHKWYDGSFSSWQSLGGSLVGGPGAVSWGPNRIDVVGRAADGTVNHWAFG